MKHLLNKIRKLFRPDASGNYCLDCGRIYYNCVCSHDDLDDEQSNYYEKFICPIRNSFKVKRERV